MQIFITGTGTNVGKTLVCSWLALKTGYAYFKPIQTGCIEETDSARVKNLTDCQVYPEALSYQAPLSPHLAARLENQTIDISKIVIPAVDNLIVEGAGGLLVPINEKTMMIDFIEQSKIPVVLVARSDLGTINHTLLSVMALKARKIPILGVIMSGEDNPENAKAIAFFGKVKVVAQLPFLSNINPATLNQIPMTQDLQKLLGVPR